MSHKETSRSSLLTDYYEIQRIEVDKQVISS